MSIRCLPNGARCSVLVVLTLGVVSIPARGTDAAQPVPSEGYVTPDDIGSRVGPDPVPTANYLGPLEIAVPGTVVEDVVVNGCLIITADDVVLRNLVIRCGDPFPVNVLDVTGFVVERSTVTCTREAWHAFNIERSQFRIDAIEVRNCDDPVYLGGDIGASSLTDSVLWQGQLGEEAHYDGVQMGSSEWAEGSLLIERNWFGADGEGCCYTAAIFADNGAVAVTVRGNWIDGTFGFFPVRCYTAMSCVVENNVVSALDDAFVLAASPRPMLVRCNVLESGEPVPAADLVPDRGALIIQHC